MKTRLAQWAGPLTSLGLLVGAIYLLDRSLKDVRWADLWRALNEVRLSDILIAMLLTAVSHWALTIYDYIGVRYIRRHVAYWRIALAAFLAYSISHSLGFPAVTGGAVRYRLYSRWGLNAVEVAQVMAMAGVTMFLGMFEIGGMAMLLDGSRVQAWTDLPSEGVNALGVLSIAVVVLYASLGLMRRAPLRLWRFVLAVPSPGFALIQIAVSAVDWLLVAAVLYVLLPPDLDMGFATFLGVFVLAYLLGVLSNVPGGLGVFESIILFTFSHSVPAEQIVTSLLVYRAVYHLLPFAIGGSVFFFMELKRPRRMAEPGALPASPPRRR